MQSSIMNKTSFSTASSSNSKINLKNKFTNIEQSMNELEIEIRKLNADTNVTYP